MTFLASAGRLWIESSDDSPTSSVLTLRDEGLGSAQGLGGLFGPRHPHVQVSSELCAWRADEASGYGFPCESRLPCFEGSSEED